MSEAKLNEIMKVIKNKNPSLLHYIRSDDTNSYNKSNY